MRTLVDAGLTVLLVEQNVRAAIEVVDRLVLLERGRVIAEGPAAEMRDDPRIIEAYLGSRRMNLVQQLVNGIVLGHAYALIAIGWTVLLGVARLVNFGHGQMYMLGAFVTWWVTRLGLPYLVAIPVAVGAGVLLGLLMQRVMLRLTLEQNLVSIMIVTLGFGYVLHGAAALVFGSTPQILETPLAVEFYWPAPGSPRRTASSWSPPSWSSSSSSSSWTQPAGRSARMVAEDPKLAQLAGINVSTSIWRLRLRGRRRGSAAALVAPRTPILTSMGFEEVIITFVVVVLGGIGSVVGSYVAGVGLGLFTALFGAFVSPAYTTAAAFVVLIVVLVLRPGGLAAGGRGDDPSARGLSSRPSSPASSCRASWRVAPVFPVVSARAHRDLRGDGLRPRHRRLRPRRGQPGAHGLLRRRCLCIGLLATRAGGAWVTWQALLAAAALAAVLGLVTFGCASSSSRWSPTRSRSSCHHRTELGLPRRLGRHRGIPPFDLPLGRCRSRPGTTPAVALRLRSCFWRSTSCTRSATRAWASAAMVHLNPRLATCPGSTPQARLACSCCRRRSRRWPAGSTPTSAPMSAPTCSRAISSS